jgi:hypothetical protein
MHKDDGLFHWEATRGTNEAIGFRHGRTRVGTSCSGSTEPLKPWFDKSWKPGDFELVK